MFTGTSKARRVGVGARTGAAITHDRASVLSRAAAEREARHTERERERAAVRVQTHVRGWRTRGNAAASLVAEACIHVRALSHTHTLLRAAGKDFVTPTPALLAITRPFASLSITPRVRAAALADAGALCELWTHALSHTRAHTHVCEEAFAEGARATRLVVLVSGLISFILRAIPDRALAAKGGLGADDVLPGAVSRACTLLHTCVCVWKSGETSVCTDDREHAIARRTAVHIAKAVLGSDALATAVGVLASGRIAAMAGVDVAALAPAVAHAQQLLPGIVGACTSALHVVASAAAVAPAAEPGLWARGVARLLAIPQLTDSEAFGTATADAAYAATETALRPTLMLGCMSASIRWALAPTLIELLPSSATSGGTSSEHAAVKDAFCAQPLVASTMLANFTSACIRAFPGVQTNSAIATSYASALVTLLRIVPLAALAMPSSAPSGHAGDRRASEETVSPRLSGSRVEPVDETDIDDDDIPSTAAVGGAALADSLPPGLQDRADNDVAVAAFVAERRVVADALSTDSGAQRSLVSLARTSSYVESAAPAPAPLLSRAASDSTSVSGVLEVVAGSTVPSPADGTTGKRARMVGTRAPHACAPAVVSRLLSAAQARALAFLTQAAVRLQLETLWQRDHVALLLEATTLLAGPHELARSNAGLEALDAIWRALRMRELVVLSHRAGTPSLSPASWRNAVHYVHRSHAGPPSTLLSAFLEPTADGRRSRLASLWANITTAEAAAIFRGDVSRALIAQPQLAATIRLFLVALDYSLTVTDDIDFYENCTLLPLEQVGAVQGWLRDLTFRLFWSDAEAADVPLSKRPLLVLETMHAAMRVYNQLFDRHCRRAFVAAEAWLWPSLPLSDINAEVLMGISDDALVDEALTGGAMAASAGLVTSAPSAAAAPSDGASTHDGDDGTGNAYADVSQARGRAASRRVRQTRAQLVLTAMPQTIPFQTRVAIFVQLRDRDRDANLPLPDGHPLRGMGMLMPKVRFTVRRTALVEDSFRAFAALSRDGNPATWKQPFQVEFINKEGLPEAGIDGGGLLKEFIDSVVREAFSPKYALFAATPDHALYPHPAATSITADELRHFEFLGRLLGKALYEGILVEPRFAHFFLRKLLGRANLVDDLQSLDPDVYRSLMAMKRYPRETYEHLGLTFEVTQERFGEVVTLPLVPGGRDIPVTADNVGRYILLVANFRLNASIAPQCRAFLRGFRELIPMLWMRMFSPTELQLLIGGSERGVDLGDLRANTHYSNGYHDQHPYIQMFWRVLASLPEEDLRAFLMFTTSCSRPPLLGFGTLHPHFGIARVPIAADNERLPSSGTCYNLLKLPQYSSEGVLREKLLYAIHSGAGFELS